MLRLISAVLHRDVGSAVPDAALDLRPGRARDHRAARRVPARAVGVARGRLGARFPTTPAVLLATPTAAAAGLPPARDPVDAARDDAQRGATTTVTACRRRDPDAARRLVRALAGALAPRRGRRLPDARRARAAPTGEAALGAFAAFAGFLTGGIFAVLVFDRQRAARRSRSATRSCATGSARSARSSSAAAACSRSSSPTPHRIRSDVRRRVLRAARDRRRRDVLPAPVAQPDDAVPRAGVVLDRAVHPLRDRHASATRRSRRGSST